jgi:C4-dicarboxylate-specific signal transduction histidine kinase
MRRSARCLARSEVAKSGVLVEERLTESLSPVRADRVQLQQVILNLILNAVEAMSSVYDGPRELSVSTEQSEKDGVVVAARDSEPDIDPEHLKARHWTDRPNAGEHEIAQEHPGKYRLLRYTIEFIDNDGSVWP